MKRKVTFSLILLALLFTALFYYFQSYTEEEVHPRLLALKKPYQTVSCEYFMDGGSVGINIVDHDGKIEQFAIPAHLGESNRYTKVFVGAIHDSVPGAFEIENPKPTKLMLIRILATDPNRSQADDHCLAVLRKSPFDYLRVFINSWTARTP
jgi:hypothetical protein